MEIKIFHTSDTRENGYKRLIPDEDYIFIYKEIFSVFDGVSVLFQEPYPNPSPSKRVAEIAAQVVTNEIIKAKTKGLATLHTAFEKANNEIKKYNESMGVTKENVNHLDKQLASCVGAFGFVHNDMFYFAQINDSGVMVFDPLGNREVDFILNQAPFIRYVNNLGENHKLETNSKEEHLYIKKNIVNNSSISYQGAKLNFGVANGDNEASRFLRMGATSISPGQIAFLYTDGFIPFVYDNNFTKLLMSWPEDIIIEEFILERQQEGDKFRKEKSLVAIRFQ